MTKRLTAFKLTHLLKSILVAQSSTLWLCVWASVPISDSRIILGHLRPIIGRNSCRIYLSWGLLAGNTSGTAHVMRLDAIVKPWLEHLARFFGAVAPRHMLAHLLFFSLDSYVAIEIVLDLVSYKWGISIVLLLQIQIDFFFKNKRAI